MWSGWRMLAIAFAAGLLQAGAAQAEGAGASAESYRLSEPATHGNLAIYFVRGKSRSGPVPLTLQEALAKGVVLIRETGRVHDIEVENAGDEEVFIQSGDIVKGGKQDRVLSVSLVVAPHSGAVSVPSFCVESGRWSERAGEDVRTFSIASSAMPSRAAKIEMAGSVASSADRSSPAAAGARQQEIWKGVALIQRKLSAAVGATVAAPRSQTSLQLTLENSRIEGEIAAYVGALQPLGERDDDIVGYAFAVNGKLNSADIYPSNGLFRKMWPKLLRASAIEAIGEREAANEPAPPASAVMDFIVGADSARVAETNAAERARIKVRESGRVMSLETRPAAAPVDAWTHRSYIAK